MRPCIRYLFLLFLLSFPGWSSASVRTSAAVGKTDSLIRCAMLQSKYGNFAAVAVAARELRALGDEGDRTARLYGLIYTGHALAREVNDSVKYYYGQAEELAAAIPDYRALAAIYNALAIYTSEMEMNYLGGLSYFMQALRSAEKSPDSRSYPVILNNMAMAHYLRNDPSGLKYALEVVAIGEREHDSLLLYSGSFVAAYMHYLSGDYPDALRSILRALRTGGEYIEYAEAYSLYANILARLGRDGEALTYYRRALDHVGEERSNTLAYLNFGGYLMEKGRAAEAVGVLEKGLDHVDRRNNAFYRYQLYEKLSEAYGQAGRTRQALAYYRMFHREYDSIFNIARERAIRELSAQYEYEKQKREIREKELALLRERQKLNLTVLVAALLVLLIAVLLATVRRKNRRYREIVRQQHELIRKEKMIERLRAAEGPGGRDTDTSSTDEKEQALYAAFEQVMKAEKLYRRRDVTIEKVAEKLSTNRTYLSRAINGNGGMSFSQHVNAYRIEEARRILSETDTEIQIKALAYELGFSTPETFSTSFRKAIGMLPSKFREQMRKMYGSDAGCR